MNSKRFLNAAIFGVVLLGSAITVQAEPAPEATSGRALPRADAPMPSDSTVPEIREDTWRGGAGFGMLGSTPDGTAFTTDGHADYFLTDQFSVGPLLQVGFTNDMAQIGLSGPAFSSQLGNHDRCHLRSQARRLGSRL